MGANFVKNNASNGGCVELYHSRTTMISNSNFSDNKAERSGGAIALHNTSKLLIYGSMFVGEFILFSSCSLFAITFTCLIVI